MNDETWRIFRDLAARQHGVVAVWQLLQAGLPRTAVDHWIRRARPPRIHRGVYGTPGPLGSLMAAALALGPAAAISHMSGVELWGMIDPEPHPIHVSVPGDGGRRKREGLVVHRPMRVVKAHRHGIPVLTPTQCLKQAELPPHHLYRALEKADKLWLSIDRPSLPLSDIVALQRIVKGTTKSPAEARFLLLCAGQKLELPLVNHRLNGFETDFHWPRHRLVVEVDGWEFHKERAQFEEDRRRGIAHRIAGYEVIRASALQVELEPDQVVRAVLAAAPALRTRSRRGSASRARGSRSFLPSRS